MTNKKIEKIDKKGRTEEWSWVETPETLKALEIYHEVVRLNKEKLGE